MVARLSSAARLGAAFSALFVVLSAGGAKPPDLPQIERPVCEPQTPALAQKPVLPQSLVVESGQEESEVRAAANRHAALRRLARCLLIGTHPLLPLVPFEGVSEEAQEPGPDDLDPGMVRPADRLFHGGQPGGPVVTPAIESLLRMLGQLQSQAPPAKPPVNLVASDKPVRVEVEVLAPSDYQPRPSAYDPPAVTATSGQADLTALEEAQKIYRQGEAHRAFGQLAKAKACYEKVCELCPGTQHASLAASRLVEVNALLKLVGDDARARPKKTKVARTKPVEPSLVPAEPVAIPTMPPVTPTVTVNERNFDCPYLKDQSAPKAAACEPVPPLTVLDNFERLQDAEKALRTAEFFERAGNAASATFYYEMARKLCPGSSLDELAASSMKQMHSQAVAAANPEEQEVKPARIQVVQPKASPEADLEKRLKTSINVNYSDVPLATVLEDFRSQGLNIVLDRTTLESEGVNLYRPITIKLEDVPVKSTLTLILKQLRLAYKVEDAVLVVTTAAAARGKLMLRTFKVGDLVEKMEALCQAGVVVPGSEKMTPEQKLIRCLTGTIYPESWAEQGGFGTVEFFPLGSAMVVNQTPEVHEQIAELLTTLRRMAKETRAAGGEEQQTVAPEVVPAKCREPEVRVHEMLEACQRAFLLGKYGEAESLARQAMDVDARTVSDHPLVKKNELFLKITKARRQKAEPIREAPMPPARKPESPAPAPRSGAFEFEIVTEEQEAPPKPPASKTFDLDLSFQPKVSVNEVKPADCDCCSPVAKLLEALGAAVCSEVEGQRGCCQLFLGCVKLKAEWARTGKGAITIDVRVDTDKKTPECP